MTADRLHVCLVGPLPPPSGGMANQTRQLAELLRGEGFQVDLVQTNAPYRPAFVRHLRVVRALFRLIPYFLRLWKQLARADVVHLMANSGWSWFLYSVPASIAARLRAVPLVVNYRGGEAEPFLERNAWAVRLVVRRAAALVVPSGFLQQVFQRFGMASVIVPNIVDLARFRPSPRPAGQGIHLLVARNLEPIYDNETAIRALALLSKDLPHARLTIAGEGPLSASLERLARELGVADQVRLCGRLANADMPGLYASADVCLNPSLVDNMPISLLESLASGVPVVSTRVGGVPYLVEHERTALLVEPGDPGAMARAVLRLLRDEALAARLKSAGLEHVRRFDWPSVRPRLLAVYAAATNRGVDVTAGVA
jgi:glycosyltransferase involved in cell wall biosynthesis